MEDLLKRIELQEEMINNLRELKESYGSQNKYLWAENDKLKFRQSWYEEQLWEYRNTRGKLINEINVLQRKIVKIKSRNRLKTKRK